jgi:hypothetical protein
MGKSPGKSSVGQTDWMTLVEPQEGVGSPLEFFAQWHCHGPGLFPRTGNAEGSCVPVHL